MTVFKKISIVSLVIIVFALIVLSFVSFDTNESPKKANLHPGEWMATQRMYPHSEIKTDVYLKEMKKATQMAQESRSKNYTWELVGPTNIGGRITDIEMPLGQSDIMYIGAATGGVFKTEDAGGSWQQIFHDIPTISIGDIVLDPQNSDVIYVGTGEANSSSFSYLGSGVYKSENAGQTWEPSGLENSVYIGRMIVDHSNSERVFAAACGNLFTPSQDRGIYRSIDAGANWEQVLFVNDTTAAIDLVQDPSDANVLYAAFWERTRGLLSRHSFGRSTGIYKTIDGGDTWEELSNGLPNVMQNKGRLGITISESNPQVLYAMYDMPESETWVYKTNDAGENWSRVDNNYLHGMGSSFGWYFGQVRVHPEDEEIVFTLGQLMYRTNNSGSSWSNIDNSGVHVDHHAMFFDLNSGKTYLGNDGGLYSSTNLGSSWTKINNLPITQFYAYDVSETNQDFQVGGTQDNNSIRTITGAADSWEAVLGGDGMYNRINQQNNNIAYAEYQWGALSRSYDATSNSPYYEYIAYDMSDDRNNWSAPLELVPGMNEIAYFGTHRVWRSTNNGDSWTAVSEDLTQGGDNYFHTLTCLDISPINPTYILAGAGDGLVHISTDNANTWQNITEGLPVRWITDVVFDPNDENTIYTTVSGFRWDEELPHVFKSTDLGQTWESISGNLPELPVNQMVINPDESDEIIVGTDAGIFMTVDGGENWESITGNMPMVPVVSFKLIPETKELYAATYGISTYKIDLDDVNVGLTENVAQVNDFHINWVRSTTNDYIQLSNESSQKFNMKVFDASGKVIYENYLGELSSGNHKIDLENEKIRSASWYIVELIGDKGSQTLKLIK